MEMFFLAFLFVPFAAALAAIVITVMVQITATIYKQAYELIKDLYGSMVRSL